MYNQRRTLLSRQTEEYRQLIKINLIQSSLNETEFRNVEQKYLANKQLYEQKVFAKLEFLDMENTYLQKKKDNENYKKVAVENQLSLSDREKQLQELAFEFRQQSFLYQDAIRQALDNIENTLIVWEQNYLLTSPIKGQLSFFKTTH